MAKTITILFALLLLSCDEKAQAKPTELPTEPTKLDCASSCDDEKIKAWYQKKYGKPISDFELSVKEVFVGQLHKRTFPFRIDQEVPSNRSIILEYTSTRTTTGAIVKLSDSHLNSKIEIGMEEWLDFVRDLSKYRIGEWEKNDELIKGEDWYAIITFLDEDKLPKPSVREYKAENGDEFDKAINNMNEKIKKKLTIEKREAEFKLSTEYQRKFGELITDFELSTTLIRFSLKTEIPFTYYSIEVTRDMTETNARASFDLEKEAELDIGEWLDFLHALHKSRFYRWKGNSNMDREKRDGIEWDLRTVNLDSSDVLKYYVFRFNNYPRNYEEFKKTMDDMAAKIKEKAGK